MRRYIEKLERKISYLNPCRCGSLYKRTLLRDTIHVVHPIKSNGSYSCTKEQVNKGSMPHTKIQTSVVRSSLKKEGEKKVRTLYPMVKKHICLQNDQCRKKNEGD